MTVSPDLSGYVDLQLFDKTPQDLFDAAKAELLLRVPQFNVVEGAMEVQLLEAIGQIVSEGTYAINRIPGAIMQILLQLFEVDRFLGTEPTVTIQFNLADTAGHVVPAGTRVSLDLGADLPVIFTTTENAAANPGESTATAGALGDRFTDQANGVSAGMSLAMIDSLFFVNSAELADSPVGGVDPEDTPTWLTRGTAALARLTSTLVRPAQFTAAALEDPNVFRATTLDNWNAGLDAPLTLAAVPSGTGGALIHGAVYGFAVTAVTAQGETLPCATVNATIPGGADTGSVVLTWAAPAAQQGAGAVTAYKVYRTAANGAVLGLIATLGVVLTYTATSNAAVGAVPPIANGTGQTLAGYETVAVYGPNGPVSAAEKTSLQAALDLQALGNLNVRVVDATVNTAAVTVHVLAAPGYSSAQITADVTGAVQAFLSTNTWDWSTTLRRNSLITVIGSLPSVAQVETLDVPAADVTLIGVAPLVNAGTITVTVDF